MDKKSVISIIFVVVVLLGCVAAALWFIPSSTPMSLSLDAVKLDASGKEIGTAKIEIQGSHLNYLFREDRYDLVIAPFDDLTGIDLTTNGAQNGAVPYFFGQYMVLSYGAWSNSLNDMVFCNLTFTKDLAFFRFYAHLSNDAPVYYVASASGDCTTQEIVEAFNGLVPGL